MPDPKPHRSRARAPILAGNWKMNKGPEDTRRFFSEFLAAYAPHGDRRVWFFPPAVSLEAARNATHGRDDLTLGVQNIHWEAAGAFTGETSAGMAREAGARVVLVGHSERRHVFGETDEQVAKKVTAALAAGLHVLVCVGETLEQRRAGALEAELARQLDAALAVVAPQNVHRLALAYEPVWAIGTGVNATPADASSAHGFLRARVGTIAGAAAAAAMPVLYGGSVNTENAVALLAAPDVDGLLVGGASLKPDSFARIAATPAD
jgi:triosephosphate isomerase